MPLAALQSSVAVAVKTTLQNSTEIAKILKINTASNKMNTGINMHLNRNKDRLDLIYISLINTFL